MRKKISNAFSCNKFVTCINVLHLEFFIQILRKQQEFSHVQNVNYAIISIYTIVQTNIFLTNMLPILSWMNMFQQQSPNWNVSDPPNASLKV